MKRKIIRETGFNQTSKITLDSDKINFKDGYGVSYYKTDHLKWDDLSYFNSWLYLDKVFIGIVDEKLNIILPHSIYYEDIKNFGNGNFIITIKYDEEKDIANMILDNLHIRIVNNIIEIVATLNCLDYKVVSPTTIVANNRIYDTGSGTYNLTQFSKIGEFKRHGIDNIKLARAIINLEGDNELICYIDTKGNIRSRIISTLDGEEINQNNPDLDLPKEITRINKKIKYSNLKYNNPDNELKL